MNFYRPTTAAYKAYVLSGMTAIGMFNQVDRTLIILLLQPIKVDLQLTDTQLGLLTGIAFGFFYATFGIPIARWADRGNRVTIISLSIGLWAITVMSVVLVSNYTQLLIARMSSAVGESGCKPVTYSLVGDYFPQAAARTRAMSIYVTGTPLAAMLSYFLGGWLNELYGWRLTVFLLGIPGLALAILVKLTIIEPRMQACTMHIPNRRPPSMAAVLAILWRRRSCRHLCIALILLFTMGLGLGPWYAAFMMRSHGMRTTELGLSFGLIFGLGGIAGILIGGYGSARWFSENERGQLRVSAVTVACLVPCYVAFLMLPQKRQALIALLPVVMALSIYLGPTYALLQRLVADEMRATMMAVVMMLANLIGMGAGPEVVGSLSDLLRPLAGSDSLRYAMLSMSTVAFWSAYHFWQAGRAVEEDLRWAA